MQGYLADRAPDVSASHPVRFRSNTNDELTAFQGIVLAGTASLLFWVLCGALVVALR